MNVADILIDILAVAVYSGPLFPSLVPLCFRRASQERFQKNVWVAVILSTIQALSFVPACIEFLTHAPDAIYSLTIPFVLGILMFIGASFFAVSECLELRAMLRSRHDA